MSKVKGQRSKDKGLWTKVKGVRYRDKGLK